MSDPLLDTRQRIQRAQRFFARLDSFALECPHCGDVYVIKQGSLRSAGKRSENYNPITARFRCTNKDCTKEYVLGLLAWPITPAPRVASATPEDQVPSPRQLAQMRKEGGGWWMADQDGQRYARPHTTNQTTEPERGPDDEED